MVRSLLPILCALLLWTAAPASAVATFVTSSGPQSNTPACPDTSVSFSFSASTVGTNRLLIVYVYYMSDTSLRVSTITYNGVAMTRRQNATNVTTVPDQRIEGWLLVNPALGANTVTVTMLAVGFCPTAVAMSFAGVNQVTPDSTPWAGANSGTCNGAAPFRCGPMVGIPTGAQNVHPAAIMLSCNTNPNPTRSLIPAPGTGGTEINEFFPPGFQAGCNNPQPSQTTIFPGTLANAEWETDGIAMFGALAADIIGGAGIPTGLCLPALPLIGVGC